MPTQTNRTIFYYSGPVSNVRFSAPTVNSTEYAVNVPSNMRIHRSRRISAQKLQTAAGCQNQPRTVQKLWDYRISQWREQRWLSSGLLRHVLWQFTDVSEVLAASIMRATAIRGKNLVQGSMKNRKPVILQNVRSNFEYPNLSHRITVTGN
jgi:hypothetical protein